MTAPYYQDEHVTVLSGDCLEVMAAMPDASVHAIVTDPPYGLEFMGKDWDAPWRAEGAHWREASRLPGSHSTNPTPRPQNFGTAGKPFQQWCEQWATECLRVLKPGGHMLAFGGSRTWHRLACAVEDAGFEVRDSIAWLYGSGFPKSLDVSKAIDKAAGAEREVVGSKLDLPGYHLNGHNGGEAFGHGIASTTPETRLAASQITAPATPDAERWQGWGTALKPAFEPIVVARKPLAGTVAATVLAHGTGALNVDGCRVGDGERVNASNGPPGANTVRLAGGDGRDAENARRYAAANKDRPPVTVTGRWPTNVVLDDTQAAELDRQSGESVSTVGVPGKIGGYYLGGCSTVDDLRALAERGEDTPDGRNTAAATLARYERSERRERGHNDSGGASRFFPTFRYEAKAPTAERPRVNGIAHPTVKPLELMRWLVRLVTPPGGTVLDPFAGSGTTLEAAILEGFTSIGIERETDYLALIKARISKPLTPALDLGSIA